MEHLARIDEEVLSLSRRAGVWEVFIGIESGYQDALDAMNKGAKVNQIMACTR